MECEEAVIRAGELRHMVDVEQKSGSTTDGMGNSYQTWAALYPDVPCSVRPISGRERWSADKTQAVTTHEVRMRFLDGITSGMRLKFGARYLNVNSVLNVGELDIELVLECTEAN